jgi:hypothetical protein
MSGRLGRLALGAAFRPAATGVQVISGVLAGPANTMGELALPSNTQLTVQPFRAVIQSALDATAGSYLVPNDAVVTLAVTAQNATLFRRSMVVVRVDDSQVSGVASSGTTDRAVLEIIDGALAASAVAAALPTPTGSWLALGEILIPPTGQTVTVTPYNPRTGLRHGIQPGIVVDGATTTGHDGAPGSTVGQYRDHPTLGLQRWDGTAWVAAGPSPDILTPTYASGFSDYTGGYQPLRVFRTGRQARAAGIAAPPAGNNGTLAAGTAYTVATIPAGSRPAASESAVGPLWTGTAWNLAIIQALTSGALNATPLVTTGSGWNISFAGLQWRI